MIKTLKEIIDFWKFFIICTIIAPLYVVVYHKLCFVLFLSLYHKIINIFLHDSKFTVFFNFNTVEYNWLDNNNVPKYRGKLPSVIIFGESGNPIEKQWYKNGVLHCETHPAIIRYYGHLYYFSREVYIWYINGKNRSNDINLWMIENNIELSCFDDYEIPDEYKVEFKLRFI